MTGGPDRALFGDLRQFASVRRITIDEGPERGVGALAFSTGGGLDFWLLIDRALDIGPLWRDGRPVAWQSPAGFRHPALVDPEGDGGFGFGRGFSGFLMTCGLDHTRAPRDGRPQHGRLPFLPARLTAYGESFDADPAVLFATGEIIQWRHDGEALRLRRRIEAPVGGRSLTIVDEVCNIGALPQTVDVLYHFNIGHPALTPDTTVLLDGEALPGPQGDPVANAADVAFSRPLPRHDAVCVVRNAGGPILSLSVSGETLPHLQLWRDRRPFANILAIEPCTSARDVSDEQRTQEQETRAIQPGAQRCFVVKIQFP
ncbi:MAG: DUF4432 family protein [Proteobacteria bacterium]|nr:DUF4432 family protein [Pseudomonadota bacterium]